MPPTHTLPFDVHDLGREVPDLNDLLHLDLGLFLSPEGGETRSQSWIIKGQSEMDGAMA